MSPLADAASETADAGAVVRLTRRRQRRRRLLLIGLAAVLAVVCVIALGLGAVPIGSGEVLAILARPLGISLPWDFGQREETVLLAIRLPRALLGLLAGAALALSGAALQGLFRNPLADPSLIGVSMGAALAAVAAIVLGGTLAASLPAGARHLLLPAAAFLGGLLATLTVYKIAERDGHTDVATMLLAGIALNAIASAGIGLLIFISDDQQLRDLNFWLLGSLGGNSWSRILPIVPFVVLPLILLPLLARYLNAMALGEREALHLGFDVERTKRLIVVLVALATGATVALTGVIGFVGLVVPHLIRLLAGPNHRTLLPAAILLGAILMLLADLCARLLVLPAELPVGILTSCIGGPFFIWLLIRRRALGGW